MPQSHSVQENGINRHNVNNVNKHQQSSDIAIQIYLSSSILHWWIIFQLYFSLMIITIVTQTLYRIHISNIFVILVKMRFPLHKRSRSQDRNALRFAVLNRQTNLSCCCDVSFDESWPQVSLGGSVWLCKRSCTLHVRDNHHDCPGPGALAKTSRLHTTSHCRPSHTGTRSKRPTNYPGRLDFSQLPHTHSDHGLAEGRVWVGRCCRG